MPGTLPLRRYDIVICDIDGCLVPESSTPFDVASLAKVAEHNHTAVERGDRPIVTVCSGRPQPFAEAVCRLIGNTLVPCVCENGVWLYFPGNNIYAMDPAIGEEHLAAVREASLYLQRTYGPHGVSQQPGKAASISLYHPDPAYLRGIEGEVAGAFEREGWPLRVSMTWFYINCDLKHISKGTALDRLLGQLRIPKERIAGIGDTTGDKFIADRAGLFACPANAQPQIRELAHYISPHAEAAGVVDILERLSS